MRVRLIYDDLKGGSSLILPTDMLTVLVRRYHLILRQRSSPDQYAEDALEFLVHTQTAVRSTLHHYQDLNKRITAHRCILSQQSVRDDPNGFVYRRNHPALMDCESQQELLFHDLVLLGSCVFDCLQTLEHYPQYASRLGKVLGLGRASLQPLNKNPAATACRPFQGCSLAHRVRRSLDEPAVAETERVPVDRALPWLLDLHLRTAESVVNPS